MHLKAGFLGILLTMFAGLQTTAQTTNCIHNIYIIYTIIVFVS